MLVVVGRRRLRTVAGNGRRGAERSGRQRRRLEGRGGRQTGWRRRPCLCARPAPSSGQVRKVRRSSIGCSGSGIGSGGDGRRVEAGRRIAQRRVDGGPCCSRCCRCTRVSRASWRQQLRVDVRLGWMRRVRMAARHGDTHWGRAAERHAAERDARLADCAPVVAVDSTSTLVRSVQEQWTRRRVEQPTVWVAHTSGVKSCDAIARLNELIPARAERARIETARLDGKTKWV